MTKSKLFSALFCLIVLATNVCAQYEKWHNSINGLQMPAFGTNNPSFGYQSLMPLLLQSNVNNIKSIAEQALKQGLHGLADPLDVSGECLNHTEIFLQALISGEKWALSVIDAMGKPPSGIMNGDLNWIGSYDQCLAIEATVNVSGTLQTAFTNKYCKAMFPMGSGKPTLENPTGAKLTIGLCLPDSCSNEDTTILINTLLELLPFNTTGLPKPQVTCLSQSLDFDTKAMVVIAVCSLFGLLMTVATAYDVIVIHWLKSRRNTSQHSEIVPEKYEKLSDKGKTENFGTTEQTAPFQNGDAAQNGKKTVPVNMDVAKAALGQTQTEEIKSPGKLGQVLLSFSIYTNGAKILNTNRTSGTLAAVNGIRFVSMTWVIFGHSYGSSFAASNNLASFAKMLMKRFTFQAIENAYVSVDTFFTLSGLLVSYLCLKEMKKRDGARKFNWAMFYFHRFWRLTPPYMLFIMFYVCLTKYFSNGPLWSEVGMTPDGCKDTWWKNLVYVNNLVDTKHQCMGWSWYLANDMQFFIVSPLMLIPLYYSPLLGTLSCVAFILINFVSVGVLASRSHLNALIIAAAVNGQQEEIQQIYIKPWCRIGPYAVGFLTGYILYRTECKIRIPKIINLFGWIVAIATGFTIVYGLYDSSGFPDLGTDISALYHATHRSAWGAAVCWVIVACATGNGGFVNTLLSWKAFIPLARLTYCAYLVHPVVHFVYFNSKRSLLYLTDLEESYAFIGNVVISYAVAFVTSLTFEAPMMGLEKALLGRGKNS